MQCDVLIEARWVVPVQPRGVVLEHHAVAIVGSQIMDLGPIAELRARYQAAEVVQLPEHALLPGLVNAHTHIAMSLMRGLADDLPLMKWLNEHIWPVEGKFVSADFVRDGSELAIAEMLRSGITAFQDGYFYADVVAETAARMGMRAVAGAPIIEYPSGYAASVDEYLAKAEAGFLRFRDHPLVQVAFAPHAPYSVADSTFERIRDSSERLQARMYCHVHETAQEVNDSLQQYGVRPIARLHRLGMFSERFTAVHMTQLTDQEINLISEQKVHVAHCPESNLKLASGFCPVEKLLRAGVNVALGTDGAASNNDLDLLGEMKTAALLAKAVAQDAEALNAVRALEIATLGGAKALGQADRIGSIEIGKQADLIALVFDQLDSLPIYHIVSQIVYTNHRRQVSHSWIAGRASMQNGELVNVDQARIRANAWQWHARITGATSGANDAGG